MKVSLFSVCDYYEDLHPPAAEFLEEQVRLGQWAEELGFEGFFIAEHHFHPYGLVPDALQLLTLVADRTERILLGPAVAVLPFHHPLRIAEQFAVLDQISNGRVVPGVGSGYLQHEFEGFNMTPAKKRQHFDEALEVMEKALTGKRFSHRGEFFTVPKTVLNVRPFEGRKLEPKIAILTELAAYHVGKRGYGIMTVPYATVETIDDAAPMFANYRKGWNESGKEGDGEVFCAVHTHCTSVSAEKNEVNRRHMKKYVYSRLYARHADYDECLERGVIATGTPDEVVRHLQRVVDTGVDHLMLMVNYGGLPPEEVRSSLELIRSEVVPGLVSHTRTAA